MMPRPLPRARLPVLAPAMRAFDTPPMRREFIEVTLMRREPKWSRDMSHAQFCHDVIYRVQCHPSRALFYLVWRKDAECHFLAMESAPTRFLYYARLYVIERSLFLHFTPEIIHGGLLVICYRELYVIYARALLFSAAAQRKRCSASYARHRALSQIAATFSTLMVAITRERPYALYDDTPREIRCRHTSSRCLTRLRRCLPY